MTDAPEPIERTPQWWALANHQAEIADVHLRDLFAADPARGERLRLELGDLYVDYSKHRLTDQTLSLLFDAGPHRPASPSSATPCSPARRSTSPRTAPCCTWRCGPRATR